METSQQINERLQQQIQQQIDQEQSISIQNNQQYVSPKQLNMTNKQYNLMKIQEYLPNDYHKYLKVFDYSDIAQRSDQWFKIRKLTASKVLNAVDYKQMAEFILEQSSKEKTFVSNVHVTHGKNFENLATAIYKYAFQAEVLEVSIVPHDKYDFIGATPDGFVIAKDNYEINNGTDMEEEPQQQQQQLLMDDFEDNPNAQQQQQQQTNIEDDIESVPVNSFLKSDTNAYKAKLLEIKCPTERIIYAWSDSLFTICPYVYLAQCWLQMECCNMDSNDFWQVKIRVFDSLKQLKEKYDDKQTYSKQEFKKLHEQYYKKSNARVKQTEQIRPIITINDDRTFQDFDVVKNPNISFKGAFIILQKLDKNNTILDANDLEYIIDLDLTKKYNDQCTQMTALYKQYKQEQQQNGFVIYKGTNWKLVDLKFWRFDHGHLLKIHQSKGWIKNNIQKMINSWKYICFLKENQDCWKQLKDNFEQKYKIKYMEKQVTAQPKFDEFIRDLQQLMRSKGYNI